jgi:hypothetical protein
MCGLALRGNLFAKRRVAEEPCRSEERQSPLQLPQTPALPETETEECRHLDTFDDAIAKDGLLPDLHFVSHVPIPISLAGTLSSQALFASLQRLRI